MRPTAAGGWWSDINPAAQHLVRELVGVGVRVGAGARVRVRVRVGARVRVRVRVRVGGLP